MSTTTKPEEVKVEEIKPKLVEIELTEAFITNDKVYGPGKVSVDEAMAEDLTRRQKEFNADQKKLMSNNGETIDAMPGGLKG